MKRKQLRRYQLTEFEKQQTRDALAQGTTFRSSPRPEIELAPNRELEKRISELDGKVERARVEQALQGSK